MSAYLNKAAVLGLLAAADVSHVDGEVQTTIPTPYVVVFSSVGSRLLPTMDQSDPRDVTSIFQFTCVGSDPNEMTWIADRAADAVIGKTPISDERKFWPITNYLDGGPNTRNDLSRTMSDESASVGIFQIMVRSTRKDR